MQFALFLQAVFQRRLEGLEGQRALALQHRVSYLLFLLGKIGGVGLLKDVHHMATAALKRPGDALILIGATKGHLGQSLYLREIEGREEGAAPPVDLAAEKRNGDFVRGLIETGRVDTVHDCSDGGLLAALATWTGSLRGAW